MRKPGLARKAQSILAVLPVAFSACGSPPAETPRPAVMEAPPPTPAPPPGDDLVLAADRRDAAPLLAALASPDVRHRRAGAWLLGRFPSELAQPQLAHALSDPDATVRAYAASALAQTDGALPSPLQHALLGALAAEHLPSEQNQQETTARLALLAALARVDPTSAEPALTQALTHGNESERVAACRALGQRTTDAWSEELLQHAARLASEDALPSTREACWFALGRTQVAALPAADLRTRALQSIADPNPEIRGGAARVLGRIEADEASQTALITLSRDAEWRVAVQALRALLQTHPSEALLLQTLNELVAHWWPQGTAPTGGALHVLLTGLDAASAVARSTPINAFAVALHTRASHPREPVTRDQGLLHCAAARLVDLGRGWPTRVDACGLEQVSEAEQAVLQADVLGRAEGAAAQRETFLARLFRSSDPRVRQAVLAACASLPPETALSWALRGLEDADIGVVIAALELATTLTNQARQTRDAAAMQATLEGRPFEEAPLLPRLPPALVPLAPRLVQADHLEALVAFHHLVVALARPENQAQLAPLVAPQRSHPVEAVRASASEAEIALGVESNAGEIAPPSNPVAQLQLDARVLHLTTPRGEIAVALHPDLAPTTVTRIAELVDAGFYEGLTFHRVVPGFVAQGGDPRGDGYGDAGWSQRCEDPPTPYDRGVVGMALAGRDTGGSQFFITTGPAHHLDGRYTAFGHVLQGMEAVDALQAGDTITHATIERGEPSAPYPSAVLE